MKPVVFSMLTLQVPEMKKVDFTNSLDRYEAAHNELPHLDLSCLSASL